MKAFFQYRKPNFQKLIAYGFSAQGGEYVFRTPLFDGQFGLTVKISKDGAVKTELLDILTEEPYTLHLVEDAAGEFVGRVREEYETAMEEIAARCFERQVFQSEVTLALIAHVREKYGDKPEYLWEKFPDNAVWRRKDNEKWYGAILTVERRKLGMEGKGNVEVLDVRADPREIPLLTDGKRVFPGWHMNKKHWLSLPLDGTVPLGEAEEFLEESFQIAGGR